MQLYNNHHTTLGTGLRPSHTQKSIIYRLIGKWKFPDVLPKLDHHGFYESCSRYCCGLEHKMLSHNHRQHGLNCSFCKARLGEWQSINSLHKPVAMAIHHVLYFMTNCSMTVPVDTYHLMGRRLRQSKSAISA